MTDGTDTVPRGIDVGAVDTWNKRAIGARPALICCQRTIAAVADVLSGAGDAIVTGIRSKVLEAGLGSRQAAFLVRFLISFVQQRAVVPSGGGIIILPGGSFPGTPASQPKEISLGDYSLEETLNSLPWAGSDINLAMGNIRLNPQELAIGLHAAAELARQTNRKLSPCSACIRERIWPQKPDTHRFRRRVRSRQPN